MSTTFTSTDHFMKTQLITPAVDAEKSTSFTLADQPGSLLAPSQGSPKIVSEEQGNEEEDLAAREAVRRIIFPRHSVFGGGIAARMMKNSTAEQEINEVIKQKKKTSKLREQIEMIPDATRTFGSTRTDHLRNLSEKVNVHKQIIEEAKQTGPGGSLRPPSPKNK